MFEDGPAIRPTERRNVSLDVLLGCEPRIVPMNVVNNENPASQR
jgi:hypothetical protein